MAMTEARHDVDMTLQLKPQRLMHRTTMKILYNQVGLQQKKKTNKKNNNAKCFQVIMDDYHKEREVTVGSKRQPEKKF